MLVFIRIGSKSAICGIFIDLQRGLVSILAIRGVETFDFELNVIKSTYFDPEVVKNFDFGETKALNSCFCEEIINFPPKKS